MNWDWFYAIYSISAVILIVSFLWKIVEKLVIILLVALFNQTASIILISIVSIIPYYLISSFSALVVNGIGEGYKTPIVIIAVGLFILFNDLISIINISRDPEDAMLNTILDLRYAFIILGLVYYVFAVFNHTYAINKVTIWLSDVLSWIQNIPLLNWIIAAIAFLYAIYIVIMALLTVFGMITSIFVRKDVNV